MAINQALPCSPVWVLQLLFVFQLQELDTDTTTPSVQHWKAGSGPGNKTIRLKLMSNFQPLCVHVYSMPHCEHTFNAKEYQYSYNSYSVTIYITESHAHLQASIAIIMSRQYSRNKLIKNNCLCRGPEYLLQMQLRKSSQQTRVRKS